MGLSRGIHTGRQRCRKSRITSYQAGLVKSWLQWASRVWGIMTEVQRQTWRDYANDHAGEKPRRWGNEPGGFAAFVRVNCIRRRNGLSVTTYQNPPITPVRPIITAVVAGVGGTAGWLRVDWNYGGSPSTQDQVEICRTPYKQSDGEMITSKGMKYAVTTPVNSGTYTIKNLRPGGRYGVRLRFVRADGAVGSWIYTSGRAKA